MHSSKMSFYQAHLNLIVKALEELQFEEILPLERSGCCYKLKIDESTFYTFNANLGAWSNIHIEKDSLKKSVNGEFQKVFTMNDFFKEIQDICQMSDDTLSKYIEEGNQTIYSDLIVMDNLEGLEIAELLEYDYHLVDQLLSGHPKLIMNKGRIGWGIGDINKYAPESLGEFKLRWLAAHHDIVEKGFDQSISNENLIENCIDQNALNKIDMEEFVVFAVHPWQWDQYIQTQFFEQIVSGKLIDLGLVGKEFTPQVSIRTLTQADLRSRYDIKTSLSILNTSCVRGLPGKYIPTGHLISNFIQEVIQGDSLLNGRIDVLKEVAALRVKHSDFDGMSECSYRYKEMLASVWREGVHTKLKDEEKAIPTAALFCHNTKTSFIKEIILASGKSSLEWIRRYFEVVIIPLYHLQVEHGIGLVSHGQNIILVLRDNLPCRVIIKDFHGDLRMSESSKHLNDEHVGEILDKLPGHYLIHDLITGHFISVLRYVSRIMKDESLLDENIFYKTLGQVIQDYEQERSQVVDSRISLLKQSFEKVLVNKVRYIVGYSEVSERPRPQLGKMIINPLVSGQR